MCPYGVGGTGRSQARLPSVRDGDSEPDGARDARAVVRAIALAIPRWVRLLPGANRPRWRDDEKESTQRCHDEQER
jgi:hypothetical protein